MKPPFSTDFTLGILGGGQLGRMLLPETSSLDVRTAILDPSANAPCATKADRFVQGSFNDEATVLEFGRTVDLLTIEIEHVSVPALKQLVKEGVKVCPSPELLEIIQNKVLQKRFYREHDIPTAPFFEYETKAELEGKDLNFPCVQKAATGGYDGRGVNLLHETKDLSLVGEGPGLVEDMISDKKEISVIVARRASGETSCFPAVEMEFHPTANLVEFLFAPASIGPELEAKAQSIAIRVAEAMGLEGILAVELFVTGSGEILVNEAAPRPHNSGHQTIEGNLTSQYAQHLRAILNLPLGDPALRCPSVMVNLLGAEGFTGLVKYEGMDEVLGLSGTYVHLYGKAETRPFRKMGHVTTIGESLEAAVDKARFVQKTLKVIS